MAITPQPGWIVNPQGNGVIPDPNATVQPGGIIGAPAGTPATGTSGAPVIPPPPGITPPQNPVQTAQGTSGAGVSDNTFLGLLNGMNTGFQQNNALVDQKNAVLGALFGTPVDPATVAKLPQDIQHIIQGGNRDQLMLQAQILTDSLNNKNASIASSIQYLTSGWQTAQQRYDQENTNLLNWSKAYNVAPGQLIQSIAPDVWKSMSPEQQSKFMEIKAPLLTSTQIPNLGGSYSVSIPEGTIASQTNNPLNIKYTATTSSMGGSDSGLQAKDGGTFAAFSDPQAGLTAAVDLLKSPLYSGLTVDQAMRQWSNSGYGAEVSPSMNPNQKVSSLSTDQLNTLVSDMATRESGSKIVGANASPQVVAYADGIKNGTITSIAQVPTAYKSLVAMYMDKMGISSPLADSRFTISANRIASYFIALPGYSLTANGLPYLERISSALGNPGSVSDADLLDSLVKLNTAGNSITDAQVSIVTGGKSFSDMVNVWQNKLSTGGVLSDDQRKQIQKLSISIYKNYEKGYQPIYDQVTKQLTDAQIPSQFWTIPDLNALAKASGLDLVTGDTSGSSTSSTSSGTSFKSDGGNSYTLPY